MRRCLIIANQTLGGAQLVEAVQERITREAHEFYVVVPATPLKDQEGVPGTAPESGPSLQDRAYALARQRLDRALREIADLGGKADGEVGDADPYEAARLAASSFGADEVIVSTLPLGLSRWLRGNLPARIERGLDVPVVRIVGQPEPGA
jgi:nucleotide-binding universal stress UspA family protein